MDYIKDVLCYKFRRPMIGQNCSAMCNIVCVLTWRAKKDCLKTIFRCLSVLRLIFQSWDNVANVHELLTVHIQRKSKQYPVFQYCPLVQCVCAMATFSLCSNIESTRTSTLLTSTALHSRMYLNDHPCLCTRQYNSDQL